MHAAVAGDPAAALPCGRRGGGGGGSSLTCMEAVQQAGGSPAGGAPTPAGSGASAVGCLFSGARGRVRHKGFCAARGPEGRTFLPPVPAEGRGGLLLAVALNALEVEDVVLLLLRLGALYKDAGGLERSEAHRVQRNPPVPTSATNKQISPA